MKIAIAEERAYTRRRERQFEDAIDALKREAHRRGR